MVGWWLVQTVTAEKLWRYFLPNIILLLRSLILFLIPSYRIQILYCKPFNIGCFTYDYSKVCFDHHFNHSMRKLSHHMFYPLLLKFIDKRYLILLVFISQIKKIYIYITLFVWIIYIYVWTNPSPLLNTVSDPFLMQFSGSI